MDELVALRRELHRHPELSGNERETAARIVARLQRLRPDRLWARLGGHGVAAAFDGRAPGPTVLFRCELDALPITEVSHAPHRSTRTGLAHACGHDGHMAIVCGLAAEIAARRPSCGRAVVLFQPAEETGAGARRVTADPRFAELGGDDGIEFAFALHNLPGHPPGTVVLRSGTMMMASRGLRIVLEGRTSHAAHPEDGLSPARALAELVHALDRLTSEPALADESFHLVTVVHARLGERAFGTSPGHAEVAATLRAATDATMQRLVALAVTNAEAIARHHGLSIAVEWSDGFDATVNATAAVDAVRAAARSLGLPLVDLDAPFRWSEDFGALAGTARHAAMFGFGAGEACPQLHANDYDFPDALIEPGIRLFTALARGLLGGGS